MVMSMGVNAQRYLTPQFAKVKVTTAAYGFNYTVLAVPSLGHTIKQPLPMDVYTPEGDAETKRPLVIYLHTGNFLPTPQNGGPSGTRSDSTAVEICTRLSKMGFVVASADYRLGWNPISDVQEVRVNTLINAAYRGVQDVKTCVRYFKEKYATWGVDTSKIILIGQGTGGYIALGVGSLDKWTKVIGSKFPANKFFGSNGLPMVIQQLPAAQGGFIINADVEGKLLGTVPPIVPAGSKPPAGDTLNLPNWVNHSSDVNFVVNMGGALGDLSWIDGKTPPHICFHAPYDKFAPYKDDILFVPRPAPSQPLPVVRVQGSYVVAAKLDTLGTNLNAYGYNYLPKYGTYDAAQKAKSPFVGLFPLYGSVTAGALNTNDSSPWDFWAASNPNNAAGLNTNPDMSKAKAGKYIDTIIGFSVPRWYQALNLGSEVVIQRTKVTFSVDMSKQVVDPAKGVCVAGNFQQAAGAASNWTPGITKLTKKGTSSVWEFTADLPVGRSYEYKFINDDNWNGKEEKNVGCAAGGDNRKFTVGAGPTQLEGTYVYGECGKISSANDAALDAALTVAPNPTNGQFALNYNLESAATLNISVVNALGQVVLTREIKNASFGSESFDMTNMNNGVYMLQVSNGTKQAVKRVVIQQ